MGVWLRLWLWLRLRWLRGVAKMIYLMILYVQIWLIFDHALNHNSRLFAG